MLHIHFVRMQQSHGPETSSQGDQIMEPATLTRKRDQSLLAEQYIIPKRSQGQVTKVPGLAPHITTEFLVDNRNKTPRVSPHPETETSCKRRKQD